eukprot:COSAG02_NODE_708_length_18231_cov_53.208416_5_plen_329_part_00
MAALGRSGKVAPVASKHSSGAFASCADGDSVESDAASCRSSSNATAEDVVQRIAVGARSRGFDIAVGLTLQDYNRAVESDGLELPTFGRNTTLAVLLGSSKAIWVPFLAALRAATLPGQLDNQAEHDGPLNAYVVRATSSLVREVLMPLELNYTVRYAHEVEDGRLVAMQKLAHLSGVAYLHSSCGLNVHKEFGPWHAYRSLIIVDIDGIRTEGPPPNPNSPDAVAAANAALAVALESTVDPTVTNSKEVMDIEMRKVWKLWQNVRVALSGPAFAKWRYEDIFDEYHFTHSPETLARIVASEVHVGPREWISNADGVTPVLRHTKGNL